MASFHEQLLGQAGARTRAAYRKLYGPDRGANPVPATKTPRPDPLPEHPLEGVIFGSQAARDMAEEAELTWSDFAFSQHGASGTGGWLVSDVKHIIAEREEEAEGE